MVMSSSERLVEYVRSQPNFAIYTTIDGNYNHIGATIADAVLQANLRYASHVKPRVKGFWRNILKRERLPLLVIC